MHRPGVARIRIHIDRNGGGDIRFRFRRSQGTWLHISREGCGFLGRGISGMIGVCAFVRGGGRYIRQT